MSKCKCTCPLCGSTNISSVDSYGYEFEGKNYGVVVSESKIRGAAKITAAVSVQDPNNRYCWHCDYAWFEDSAE